MGVIFINLKKYPSGQKPVQSQQNNVRTTFGWTLFWRYFADFEQVFVHWDSINKVFTELIEGKQKI